MSKTRRDNGEGCYYFDKRSETYQFKIIVDGVRKCYTGKTKAEAFERFKRSKSLVFSAMVERWLDHKEALVKPSTFAQYQNRVDHLLLPLFAKDHAELTNDYLQKFLNRLPLEHGTKKHIVFILKSIFDYNGVAKPTLLLPRDYTPPRRDMFSFDELAKVEAAFDDEKCGHIWKLMAFTGIRVGEACCLTPDDFKNSTLTICKTLAIVRGKKTIQTPKSKNGYRDIPLPLALWDTVEGKLPFKPSYYSVRRKFVTLTGMNIHRLRHNFASRMLQNGCDIATLAKILGDTVTTVAKTYLHTNIEKMKSELQNFTDSYLPIDTSSEDI